MLSLYNVYNDSIIYNYGVVYMLQAALQSALCSECCCQLFCTPDVPEAAANSIFLSPLLLSLLLALIKVACVAVLFFQRCVPQCRQGHSFLQCVRCRKRGYGFAFACSLDGTDFMNHFHRA